ncbi:MAG: DeoR/GlpR family DNA-binding transcription regulator [Spirochaeta sp.]|nr:DeoR/GlpR family DNA-binding transcription regulator [Spirochaeta sp.]
MGTNRLEEIHRLLKEHKKVYVNDLSARFNVSVVSVRKYLARLADEGVATRFYGGAALVERETEPTPFESIYADPLRNTLARAACAHVVDGDSIFLGSGMTCCILARELTGFSNLTVFTNNITALPDLVKNGARVYLIGGEVASTDKATLFSSWDSPHAHLQNIFVNKAFTSISGLDVKAGLTVDSIVSTRIFSQIPQMAHRWYLIADSSKFDKISIYPVADLDRIHTLITDHVPDHYAQRLQSIHVEVVKSV